MTVISSTKDAEALSLTMVVELTASPERVWSVLEDPRQLERWWGPPSYPATFTRFEFHVGGEVRYHMTGPAGDTPRGFWRIESLEPPRRIEFANGLAGEDGEPMPDVEPIACAITLEATGSTTRMTVHSQFVDLSQMNLMLDMGMEEGMRLGLGQIDGVLSGTTV